MPFNSLASGTGAGQIPLGGAEGAGGMGGLDGLMRMFQLIQTPEGEEEAIQRVMAAGIPPPKLPAQEVDPVEFETATPLANDRAALNTNTVLPDVPNQPAVGTAGMLQQGAFNQMLDPAIGQEIPGLVDPTFGNPNPQIALNPDPDMASLLAAATPDAAAAPVNPGQPQVGLNPQQAQQLRELSQRRDRPNLRGVMPGRGASNIQTSGINIGGSSRPRLTLAQLIGAK